VADLPLPTREAPRADAPPPDAESDAALVARVAAGDAEALGALYDRHGATCYALARAVVGAPDEADDVVAGAFAQLWRTAARYDGARGSVGAWVTMVTRTRALDHVRARRRRARAEERAAADAGAGAPFDAGAAPAVPLGGSAEPADAALERGETAGLVRRALATLPAPQREAILLAFFGGLSHTDVAARLGQPLGTVKTRIRAGLHRLRDVLRPAAAEGAP
jgi:RNA polymerase sigma-70 factor (ECF subfamily)